MAEIEIPSVTLCELTRDPGAYFEKTVRLTATINLATEGVYFTDERCPLGHDDQVGVNFGIADQPSIDRIRREFESKAKVTVVGKLRNIRQRAFAWYGTRFDVSAIESIGPIPGIPTVSLCDLARSRAVYFNKTVRVTAVWEKADEGNYLSDQQCPLSHDDQIGVNVHESGDPAQIKANQEILSRLAAQGNHYVMTLVGTLRDEAAHHFYWYRSRFDVKKIESSRPAREVPYEGTLEEGWIYRAEATYQPANDELILKTPLRLPYHHAGRIEWTNLSPINRSSVAVVFRVDSKAVAAAGPGRWNTTYHCSAIKID